MYCQQHVDSGQVRMSCVVLQLHGGNSNVILDFCSRYNSTDVKVVVLSSVEGGEESAAGDDSVKQMTLDEYKAEQQKLRMRAEFKLRKPSEGEDSHKWEKTVPFQRNEDFESDVSKLVSGGTHTDRHSDTQTDRH